MQHCTAYTHMCQVHLAQKEEAVSTLGGDLLGTSWTRRTREKQRPAPCSTTRGCGIDMVTVPNHRHTCRRTAYTHVYMCMSHTPHETHTQTCTPTQVYIQVPMHIHTEASTPITRTPLAHLGYLCTTRRHIYTSAHAHLPSHTQQSSEINELNPSCVGSTQTWVVGVLLPKILWHPGQG